ncbi:hypothetical protein D3C76_687750 [compost metagenome]
MNGQRSFDNEISMLDVTGDNELTDSCCVVDSCKVIVTDHRSTCCSGIAITKIPFEFNRICLGFFERFFDIYFAKVVNLCDQPSLNCIGHCSNAFDRSG